MVNPCLHGEKIIPQFRNWETTSPSIVSEGKHGHLFPGRILDRAPVTYHSGELVMTIYQEIGFNGNLLTDYALRGVTTIINLRRHIFDDDPTRFHQK